MKFSLRSSISTLLLSLTLASVSVCEASPIKLDTDNFPDPNWSIMPYGTATANRPYASSVELHGENWVLIDRTAVKTSNSAQVIYNGGSTGANGDPIKSEANQFGDFKGSVILASSNWGAAGDFYGVVLRSSGAAFSTQTAYLLGINGTNGLVLGWNVGNDFFNNGTLLESATLSGLLTMSQTANNQYILEFSFIGMTLEASVSVWDAVNNRKGDLLGTLSYTETRENIPASGYFGIRAGRYGNVRNGYFREVQIEAIPEPSTALLLLPFGALLLWRRGM